jgi:ACS family allantoate permease-like MFS transporter
MADDTTEKTDKVDHEAPHSAAIVEKGEVVELDADDALNAVAGLDAATLQLDEETESRLLRKIDMNLMPVSMTNCLRLVSQLIVNCQLMCIIYGLNYLDSEKHHTANRECCVAASNLDRNDVIICQYHGPENRPQTCWRQLPVAIELILFRSVVFFVFSGSSWLMLYKGYLGWEFPTNRLLQRLPLAKYSAFNIIMWGLVLALFATTENFGGAVVIRLFLGVFEAAVTPGFTLFVSQWYTKKEQGFRTSIWFSFNGFVWQPISNPFPFFIIIANITGGSNFWRLGSVWLRSWCRHPRILDCTLESDFYFYWGTDKHYGNHFLFHHA